MNHTQLHSSATAGNTPNLLAELREERPDVSWCGPGGLFQMAADEIERLQALVAEMMKPHQIGKPER